MYRAALCALLVVLAGCGGFASPDGPTGTTPSSNVTATQTPADTATPAPTATPEPTPEPTDTPEPTETASTVDYGGTAVEDRLGTENGYRADDQLTVTATDGLNDSELRAVVSRSMARVEAVRSLEFERDVPVAVISRANYSSGGDSSYTEQFRQFDNAKFEALFLVGEDTDSLAEQNQARSSSVLGYYSPSQDRIVIVSDSPEPRLDGEGTLAHELVHALQDQHFDLSAANISSRDAYQGRNGIVEGDASYTQTRYMNRCGAAWACLPAAPAGGGGGGDSHFGLNFLMFFPYSDGYAFVDALHQKGNWSRVNAAMRNVPDGSTEVTYPDLYPAWEPAAVSIADRTSNGWERVRPESRTDHAVLGQSAIAAGIAYTLADDYNRARVVGPTDVINYGADGTANSNDPYNYDLQATQGWAGGRMHVYQRGDESAYVWRTEWETPEDAREFATTWGAVIEHWGGERVDGGYVIDSGPYADAFEIRQNGTTVTIVNAPTREDIPDVHPA